MAIIDIPKEPALRWEWIKYQLRLKGYTFIKLAKELDIHPNNFKMVKHIHYPKMQKAIADKLIMLPQEIWPERYGSDGRPIKHSPRYPRNDITTVNKRQCVKKGR